MNGYSLNGEPVECENKFVRLKLNERTPEQAFFIYVAPKLFKMQFNKKKALGKYGDESDFYNDCSDI